MRGRASLAGYIRVWALFSAAVFFADAVLRELLEAIPGLSERTDLIAPSLLLDVGLFQLSRLKYACLKQCRSPLGFLIQRWRGGRHALRAFTVGMQHGVFCVGRCWGLMSLMFGVGGIHPGWMLVLGVICFLRKRSHGGDGSPCQWGDSRPMGTGAPIQNSGRPATLIVALAPPVSWPWRISPVREGKRRSRHESGENSCIRWAGSGDL